MDDMDGYLKCLDVIAAANHIKTAEKEEIIEENIEMISSRDTGKALECGRSSEKQSWLATFNVESYMPSLDDFVVSKTDEPIQSLSTRSGLNEVQLPKLKWVCQEVEPVPMKQMAQASKEKRRQII